MKLLAFVLGLMTATCVCALEIDEKLTLRVVKTSDSKKTILINRGKEDGLEKGDHAKFYLSVGVVARGVAIKISPTRSVWALYRLVNANYIRDEQVMRLKITAPVKITKDESKSLVSDDTIEATTDDPRDLGIPLAPGADDVDLNAAEQGAVVAPTMAAAESVSLLEKNREVYGGLYYESRTSQTTSDNNNLEYDGNDYLMLLDMGFEYYFKDESKWYSRVSLLAAFRMLQSKVMAFEGTQAEENASFFGGGMNWYPLTRPSETFKLIPFGQFMYYLGSVGSTYNIQDSQSGVVSDQSLNGAISMFTFAGGVKYFTHHGWGASAKLEYESRVDQFSEDESSLTWQKVSSGPRIMMALLYRF